MNSCTRYLQGATIAAALVWASVGMAAEVEAPGLEIRATVTEEFAEMHVPADADPDNMETKMATALSGATAVSQHHIQRSGERFIVKSEVRFWNAAGEVTQESRRITSFDGNMLRKARLTPNGVPGYHEIQIAASESGQEDLQRELDAILTGALKQQWHAFSHWKSAAGDSHGWQVAETATAFLIQGDGTFELPRREEAIQLHPTLTTTIDSVAVMDEALSMDSLTWEALELAPDRGVLRTVDANGEVEVRLPEPHYLASGYLVNQSKLWPDSTIID